MSLGVTVENKIDPFQCYLYKSPTINCPFTLYSLFTLIFFNLFIREATFFGRAGNINCCVPLGIADTRETLTFLKGLLSELLCYNHIANLSGVFVSKQIFSHQGVMMEFKMPKKYCYHCMY